MKPRQNESSVDQMRTSDEWSLDHESSLHHQSFATKTCAHKRGACERQMPLERHMREAMAITEGTAHLIAAHALTRMGQVAV